MTRSYLDTLEDIKDVMAATGCTEDDAISALLENDTIDDAIAALRSKE